MTIFSTILKECRGKAHLTQAAVGKKISKSPGFISKLEAGDSQVKVPPVSDKKIIIDLFRQKGVTDAMLKALETAWDEVLRSGGSEKNTEEPLVQLVLKTLGELPDFDRKAFVNDLEQRIYLWRNYYQTMGEFQRDHINFSQAEMEYSRLLVQMGREIDIYLEPRLRLERARLRRYLAQNDGARFDLTDSLAIANRIKDPQLKLAILIELGDFFRRSDDLTKSLECYKDADTLCIDNEINDAKPKIRIASCHLVAGDPVTAMPYCEKGLQIARTTADAHLERKAQEYLAWATAMFGKYDKARETQLRLHLQAIHQHIHPKELAKTSCYLGGYDLLCEQYEESEKHYRESLSYIEQFEAANDKGTGEKEIFIKSWVLLGLADACLHLPGQLHTADECLRESREIGRELNDVLTIARSDEHRGRLNLIEGDLVAARKCFDEARDRFEKAGMTPMDDKPNCNPYYLAGLELDYAKMEFLQNGSAQEHTGEAERIARALEHARNAERIADQFKFEGYLAKAHLWKARVLLAGQDPKIEQAMKLVRDTIEKSVKYGTSHLHSILTAIEAHILEIHKNNAGLALQLADSMIKWKESFHALKSSVDQAKAIDEWFNKLDSLHRKWKAP
jgi:transcriptional regulator with XRE-family HTH domain